MLTPLEHEELRFGYCMADLQRLARVAVFRDARQRRLSLDDRIELAWSALAEVLYTATEPPSAADMLRAAQYALTRAFQQEISAHGVDQTDLWRGRESAPNFARYWNTDPRTRTTTIEDTIIERLALAQIFNHLNDRHRHVLVALAFYDDPILAANALDMRPETFRHAVTAARKRFLALWHEHERPTGLWAANRRNNGTRTITAAIVHRRKRAALAALAAERTTNTNTPDRP